MSGCRRPQPIRDAILACLSKPRSARAIADHINRRVPVATGRLGAMQKRGLVRRLGYAAYALSDEQVLPISFPRGGHQAAKPTRSP